MLTPRVVASDDGPMSRVGWLRSVLVRIGLADAPLGPQAFESAIHLIPQPPGAGPSITTVPTVITPITSTDCARRGCGRPQGDPIHRIADD